MIAKFSRLRKGASLGAPRQTLLGTAFVEPLQAKRDRRAEPGRDGQGSE
jgi:hypothetical protein